MAQKVQRLESELRWVTSKTEELEGALAGSRSEREKLSTSLKATEAGSSLRFLLGDVLSISFGADPTLSEATARQPSQRLAERSRGSRESIGGLATGAE